MDFGDDQDYYSGSSRTGLNRPQRYKESVIAIEETTADEQRLVNRALRPGGVTDGMSEAEKLAFARSLVSKNRREVKERERRKEAALRMESDSFGYELQALENFRAEKEAKEQLEKQMAKERRADRAAQRHEEVQARLAALRGGAPPVIRPKGSLPTRMVSRGGTEYELKPVHSSSSSSSGLASEEASEFETTSKWAASSNIKNSSSHAQIEAAIAGNRKLSATTQEKIKGTASFVSKIAKPTAFAPAPTPAPAPGPSLTLEGKNAEPMMVDRQYVLARPLQLHPWQQPASMRVLKERQREVVEQQERLKEIQRQTQILLDQEQALKARVEAQKREKAKQEKNALMRKAHVPLAPPSGAAISPKVVMNDLDSVSSYTNTHSVYRSYEDADIRSPLHVSLKKSPHHNSAFKERTEYYDDKKQNQRVSDYNEEEEEEEEADEQEAEEAAAEIAAAEAAILVQKERLLAALGGSPISVPENSISSFESENHRQKHYTNLNEASSSVQQQVTQTVNHHPRGIPSTSRLLQMQTNSQQNQVTSKISTLDDASVKHVTSSPVRVDNRIDDTTVMNDDALSPGQRKRQERQRQREIEEARDAAEEASERAAQIAREASAAVTAAKQAEEAAKDAERTLLMKMKRLETGDSKPLQKKSSKINEKAQTKSRMYTDEENDDDDDGEGVFIPGLELIGVPLRANVSEKGISHVINSNITHKHSNVLPRKTIMRDKEEEEEEEVVAENGNLEEEMKDLGKYGHVNIELSEDDAHYAASRIQAVARGRAARRSVNSMMRGNTQHRVDDLQTNLNLGNIKKSEEEEEEEEEEALDEATTAEAMYAAKHEAAAIKLQALQRGRAVRLSMSRNNAYSNKEGDIVLSDKLTLEEQTQLEYAESISNVYETRHEIAAIRLQALQRGRAVRKQTRGSTIIKTEVQDKKDKEEQEEDEDEEALTQEVDDIAETLLVNQVLEAKEKLYEAEHHIAAVKVQALARGRAVRRKTSEKRIHHDTAVLSELDKATELANVYADEHHAAAIRLQAFQRGRAVRKRLKMSSSSEPTDTALLLSNKVYADEHHQAAIKLQALQRGRAVRQELLVGRRQLSFMSSSQIEANFSLDGGNEPQVLIEPSTLDGNESQMEVIGKREGEERVEEETIDQQTVDIVTDVLGEEQHEDNVVKPSLDTVNVEEGGSEGDGDGEAPPALMSNDSLTGEAPV
jgi:hypothetical protein